MKEEQVFVQRIQQGEMSAFRELVERYQKKIYYLAYDLTGNHHDAEDISQEVFIKAFRSMKKFRGDAKLSSWLYRITVNTGISQKRKKSVSNMQLQESFEEIVTESDQINNTEFFRNPEKSTEANLMQDHLKIALQKLLALQQQIKTIFSFERRFIYRYAGAVAIFLIGIFIGKFYFGGNENVKFQSNIIDQNSTLSAQQIALQNRADRYFDRSKVLLLGMINFDPKTDDIFALNLPYRKKISQNLVQEALALKNEMQDPAYDRLKQLISDLEVILLQIANLESELNIDGIKMVKSGVDRKIIMLKINLEAMQETSSSQISDKSEKRKNIM